jgi:hypothetical protein
MTACPAREPAGETAAPPHGHRARCRRGVPSLALCAALTACSGKSSAPPPADPAAPAAPAQADAATFEALLPASTRSITRWQGDTFVILQYLEGLGTSSSECWQALKRKVVSTYQVQLWRNASFFVVAGDLPLDEVERCARTALSLLPPAETRREGELTVMSWRDFGEVVGLRRGRYLVAGARAEVQEALAGPRAEPGWAARLAGSPGAAVDIEVRDYLFENLLGEPNHSWAIIFESFPTTPGTDPKEFRGRVTVHYARPEEAARAAARLARDELGFRVDLPASMSAALRKIQIAAEGADLVLRFDMSMFMSLDFAELQAWVEKHQAKQAPAEAAPAPK